MDNMDNEVKIYISVKTSSLIIGAVLLFLLFGGLYFVLMMSFNDKGAIEMTEIRQAERLSYTDVADPDQEILKAIRWQNNVLVTEDSIFKNQRKTIENNLKYLPFKLKQQFVAIGGYINLSFFNDNTIGTSDILVIQSRSGVKKLSNVTITLNPTEKDINESIIHEFGHFASYYVYKESYSEDLIPHYDEEHERFIKNETNSNDYFLDKPEYFAEMFEYAILTPESDYKYKDAYIIRDFIEENFGEIPEK